MEGELAIPCEFSEELSGEIEAVKAIFEDQIKASMIDANLIRLSYREANLSVDFYINENYPMEVPHIKVNSHIPELSKTMTHELELLGRAELNQPMLYSLISKANDMNIKTEKEQMQEVQDNKICRFFMQGKCKFGDKCLNVHDKAYVDKNYVANKVNNNKVISQNTSKKDNEMSLSMKKKSRSVNNVEEGVIKKKSMRTAIDVIQRIQWDDALPTEDFSVGYLDRFIGIQEKKFTDFSWEDIASVDYNVLAIPKHRIQYFKYKDVKVWDKQERMDKVFGSTGETETILEIIETWKNKEEIVANEVLLKEIHEDDILPKKFSDKNRPNYFLCVRVTNEKIKNAVEMVQKHILSFDERLEDAIISTDFLHITLCMFRLNGQSDCDKAIEVLQSLSQILNCMLSQNTEPLILREVENFRNLVLYVNVLHHTPFLKFNEIAMLKLKDAGIHLCGNYDVYHPHMTIMKLSRPLCKRLNIDGFNTMYYEKFSDHYFGEQKIYDLKICECGPGKSSDKFYVQLGSVENSLYYFSDILPTIILENIQRLTEAKEFPPEDCEEVIQSLQSDDVSLFEQNIQKLLSDLKCLPVKEDFHFVFILRGLPGSGKSFIINQVLENTEHMKDASGTNRENRKNFVKVCSADEYFNSKSREFEFKGEEIASAHQYCRDQFINAIQNDANFIFVDNTHSMKWEYEIYERVGLLSGYQVIILEILCENESMQQKYLHRCKHNLKPAIHRMIYDRWQDDLRGVPLNTDINSSLSLDDLIRLNNDFRETLNSKSMLYAALFLDGTSKNKLLTMYPAAHEKIFSDHVTLIYKPKLEDLKGLPIGKHHKVMVSSYYEDKLTQLVAVQEKKGNKICELDSLLVTISTAKNASPADSLKKLQTKDSCTWQIPRSILYLTGIVGVQVAITKHLSRKCIDPITLNELVLRNSTNKVADADTHSSTSDEPEETSITKSSFVNDIPEVYIYMAPNQTVKQLYIFDFDGTLFHTPDRGPGMELYKRETGSRWPHRGWIGCKESLLHPLLVYPGPALQNYFSHYKRPESATFLLTGRREKTREGVESVLKQWGLYFDQVILTPDDCKLTVFQNKSHVVSSLLQKFPAVTEVKFWDDQDKNIDSVKALSKHHKYQHVHFHMIQNDDVMPDFNRMTAYDFMDRLGFRPIKHYNHVVHEGMSFINKAWTDLLKNFTKIESIQGTFLLMPFGSYLLHRKGDVDICLLAPDNLEVKMLIKEFSKQLQAYGVQYCYSVSGIRCPRIKIMLMFENAAPVEFDLLIASFKLSYHELVKALNSRNIKDLMSKCRDGTSKTAFEGILFFEKYVQSVEDKISNDDFGIIIDLVCTLLRKSYLKANAFHCIRTFHLSILLNEFILKSNKIPGNGLDTVKSMEKVIKSFCKFCSKYEDNDYINLFKGFVPEIYIEKLKSIFAMLAQQSLAKSLFMGPISHQNEKNCVTLTVVSSKSKVKAWKAMIRLEAKIGSAIRSFIEKGQDIIPGIVTDNSFTFYSSRPLKCQGAMKRLKTEIEKEFDVRVTIKF